MRAGILGGLCSGLGVLSFCLMVGAAYSASPTIHWKDNSNNEQGFRCYRMKTATLPELKVCEVGPDIETCNPSEVGVQGYCYQCSSFNSLGESGRWGQACWVPPSTPGNVQITLP